VHRLDFVFFVLSSLFAFVSMRSTSSTPGVSVLVSASRDSLVPFASVRHLSLVNAYVFGEPRFVLRGRFSLTGLPILRFRVHATG